MIFSEFHKVNLMCQIKNIKHFQATGSGVNVDISSLGQKRHTRTGHMFPALFLDANSPDSSWYHRFHFTFRTLYHSYWIRNFSKIIGFHRVIFLGFWVCWSDIGSICFNNTLRPMNTTMVLLLFISVEILYGFFDSISWLPECELD